MAVLYGIVTALALAGGFYFGYVLGKYNDLPKLKRKEVKRQEEKEDKIISEFEQGLMNLNRYDGTEKSQEDIK